MAMHFAPGMSVRLSEAGMRKIEEATRKQNAQWFPSVKVGDAGTVLAVSDHNQALVAFAYCAVHCSPYMVEAIVN